MGVRASRRAAGTAACAPAACRAALACVLACALALALAPVRAWGQQSADIALDSSNPRSNIPFKVENMLPGDSESLEASIDVEHASAVDVVFTAEAQSGAAGLPDALRATVVDRAGGETLYEGPLSGLDAAGPLTVSLPETDAGASELEWLVTVSAPTSMGNEYQGAACTVVFDWAVSYDGAPVPGPEEPGSTPGAGGGILDNLPATGDMLLMLALVLFCIGAAVCMRAAAGDREFALGGGRSQSEDAGDAPALDPSGAVAEGSEAPGPRHEAAGGTDAVLDRVRGWLRGHRRLVAAIMAIACMVLAAITAWALFWSHATIPNNRFRMGTVAVDLNDGRPILPDEGARLEPGRTVVEDFTVSNVGSSACYYRLHIDNLEGGLAPALHVRIARAASGEVLYEGSAVGLELGDACVAADPLEPGATDALTIQVSMPESAGNEYQGTDVTFDVTLDATQVKNNEGREF